MVSISDPFACTDNGDTLSVRVVVDNNSGGALIGASVQATWPTGLTGLAGPCTFAGGSGSPSCVVNAGGMSWTGDLPANSSLTIDYQVRVAAGVPVGAPLCINTVFDTGAGGGASVTECTTVDCAPTSVDLRYFRATGAGDRVTLTWETATEANALGFNVYRSTEEGAQGGRVNAALIPATGGAADGEVYHLRDVPAAKGMYFYRLEVVNREGPPDLVGPMAVRWEGPRLYLPAVVRTGSGAASAGQVAAVVAQGESRGVWQAVREWWRRWGS
jgi:hypothetical protein